MHCRKTNSFRFIVSRHRNFIILRSPFLLHPTFLINVGPIVRDARNETQKRNADIVVYSNRIESRSKKEEITRGIDQRGRNTLSIARWLISCVQLLFPVATRCFRFRKLLLEEEERKRFSRRSFSSPFFCQRGGISIKIRPRQLRRFLCHLVCYKFSQPLVDRCRRRRVKASS